MYSRLTGAPPVATQLENQRRCSSAATFVAPEPEPPSAPVPTPTTQLLERLRLIAGDHVSLLTLATEHQVPIQKIQERLGLLEEWGYIRIRRNASGMTTIIIPETGKTLRIRTPKASDGE